MAKPGDQWRPEGRHPERKQRAKLGGTCRRKAPWIRGTRSFDEEGGKRVLALLEPAGQPDGAKVVTGGVCGRHIGSAVGRKSRRGPKPGKPGTFRGRWKRLQLVDAASTAWPPKVGDAGNGYPASLWVITGGSSGGGSKGSAWGLAAVGRVRARSLGVGCFSGCS